MKTYVFAGASQRALGMYCKPMLAEYTDVAKIVGVFDANPGRAAQFVTECGGDFPVFESFEDMINTVKPDRVIVTTTDVFHSDYIIKAMEMGCDVITEKPMTTTDDHCRAILETEKRTGKKVIVTFNYRYAPFMTKIKEIINDGVIGDVFSVHFEWLLTQNMDFGAHGTSYFRRWNARMAMSSGLLVHKSTHHFDLVNWWLNDKPSRVSAFGKLNMYGAKNAPWDDVTTPGMTCRKCPHAAECKFCYKITEFEERYYAGQEAKGDKVPHGSIGLKDQCIYANDIDIYDTMSVNVEYAGGAVMSYSLNATTPYEGWRVVFNGSKGRIEATNYETGVQAKTPENHIKVFDLNDNITDYAVTKASGGHGGGDTRLRNMVFRENVPDPLGHAAGTSDGAYSILVGVAANKSIKEGTIVSIEDLLRG